MNDTGRELLPKPNPLELTPKERAEIDVIKARAVVGNKKRLIEEGKKWLTGDLLRYYNEVLLQSMPSFAFIQERIPCINTDEVPDDLRDTTLEHEASELFFLNHPNRAREIVRMIGVQSLVVETDPGHSSAHYAALYRELSLAKKTGKLERNRAYWADWMGRWISAMSTKNQDKYRQNVAENLMQMAGIDIVVNFVEKHG